MAVSRAILESENGKGGRERRQSYHKIHGWAPSGWTFARDGHLYREQSYFLAGGQGGGNERPLSPKARRWIAYSNWMKLQRRRNAK